MAPRAARPVHVLGIESSCDETGVALIRVDADPARPPLLLADALHSQIAMHQDYGGVVPELASRDHIRRLLPLLQRVLDDAACSRNDIDAVAYTAGPGLAGALLTGSALAASLAWSLGVPAWPIHHLEGHLLSPVLSQDPPQFPFVALLVSGGHTQLMRVDGVGQYLLLGETVDDAAGEAFDKSAKVLGLGYPGGPALSLCAEAGDPASHDLPRPLLHSKDLDFSFAGLKTAVATRVQRLGRAPTDPERADLAAATQAAIVEVLVKKSAAALRQTGLNRLVVAGGVGANSALRSGLNALAAKRGWRVHYPELRLCTDNGAMIALAAALRVQHGLLPWPQRTAGGVPGPGAVLPQAVAIRPRWPLDELSLV